MDGPSVRKYQNTVFSSRYRSPPGDSGIFLFDTFPFNACPYPKICFYFQEKRICPAAGALFCCREKTVSGVLPYPCAAPPVLDFQKKFQDWRENKLKIKYEFADGTVSEVEVEESVGAVIIEDRRMPPWRAGRTAWRKSGRGRKASMTFSAGSLRGLAKRRSCRWISMRSCSTGLWTSQRSIRTAGWCSPSATGRKSARRFKAGSGRGIGFMSDASGCFFYVCENRALLCMEICEDLRYNSNDISYR